MTAQPTSRRRRRPEVATHHDDSRWTGQSVLAFCDGPGDDLANLGGRVEIGGELVLGQRERDSRNLPHRRDPTQDLDMASCGVVKVLEGRSGGAYPGMPWEPKAAFAAMAGAYQHG
jgi:hypothetical protein